MFRTKKKRKIKKLFKMKKLTQIVLKWFMEKGSSFQKKTTFV